MHEYFGVAISRERSTTVFWVAVVGTVAGIAGVLLALDLFPYVAFILVIAIILVSSLIVLARSYRRALNHSVNDYNALAGSRESREYLHGAIARGYGIVKERYAVTTEIQPDGGAVATVNQVIQAVGNPIDSIDYGYTVENHPDDIRDKINMTESQDVPGHRITVRPVFSQPQAKYFEIRFEPAIKVTETVSFVLTRTSPAGTFKLDPADLPKTLPYEFSRQRVSYPTKLLTVTLLFPKGYRAEDVRLEAIYGISGLIHRQETARIIDSGCLNSGEVDGHLFSIRVSIDFPIHGIHYIIKWLPRRIAS